MEEKKKQSHLLFCFSHVSKKQDLQEAGMMARFWNRFCFPFIGLRASMPAASECSDLSRSSSTCLGLWVVHVHLVSRHERAEST